MIATAGAQVYSAWAKKRTTDRTVAPLHGSTVCLRLSASHSRSCAFGVRATTTSPDISSDSTAGTAAGVCTMGTGSREPDPTAHRPHPPASNAV